MKIMFRPFFGSENLRLQSYGIGIVIVLLICMNVWGAVRFSYVINDFGYALQNGATMAQYREIGYWLFGMIALFIATDIAAHAFLKLIYKQLWFEAVSRWCLTTWYGRVGEIEGAASRIHQSSRESAEILGEVSALVLRKIIGFIAFIPVMWKLSENFQFIVPIPGILLWFILVACLLETLVSRYLGRKIPRLEKKRQRAEAYYRTMLERIQRHRLDGRPKHDERILVLIAQRWLLRFRWRTIILIVHLLPLEIWKQFTGHFWGYGIQFALGIFVAVYVTFPLGIMMQTVAVLGEAHSALSVLSDNWSQISRLLGTVERLEEIEK